MGGRREVSIISRRRVTSSDLKQERSFFSREGLSYREWTVLVFLCCQKFVRIKIYKIRIV